MKAKRVLAAFLAAMLFFMAGCSSNVPEQLQNTINDLPRQIDDGRKGVDAAEKSYGEKIKDVKYDFTRGYTPEQMRTTRFATARATLEEAALVYDNQVKPLTKDFTVDQLTALEAQVNKVRDLIKLADTNAKEPARWADLLVYVKDNPAQVLRDSEDNAARIKSAYDKIKQQADAATKDFGHQKVKIAEKLAPFTDIYTKSQTAIDIVRTEVAKAAPHHSAVADAGDFIADGVQTYSQQLPTLEGALKGLYARETHTLIDIRVDSTLYLGRTSWYEAVDGGEVDFEFAGIPVDTATADYFAQFPADTVLATYNAGWMGDYQLSLKGVEQSRWDALRLDPGQSWPQGGNHDSSEIWMDQLEDTYCHKLKVFRNGKPDASGRPEAGTDDACAKYTTPGDIANGMYWEESDDLMAEDIGMDIYAKAYGEFPEQATETAMPPGISYVGDSTTGEWRTDSTGQHFWYYYGMYRFFGDIIGGPYPYYYRSQFDDWNRNCRYSGRSCYMPDSGGTPRFGGKSPQTTSRFPGSNYTNSGLQEATVRSSGPVARSGGPGGGGK